MSTTLITNIKQLVNVRQDTHLLRGNELAQLPCIDGAYLIIEDGIIAEYGQVSNLKYKEADFKSRINCSNQFVLPTWCDSHTHILYTGSRENEFVDKLKGLSYAEIAARGGGILNSARKMNETSEDNLFIEAWKRLEELSKMGTGAIEIKSGYRLTVEGELKMLRVIRKLKDRSTLNIRSTFLGAHTYPLEFKENHKGYIDLIINDMLPIIEKESLADYIDVFCENGFFSVEETETICKAGIRHGLKPKIH